MDLLKPCIESNQNETEKTYLNGIIFKGKSHTNYDNTEFMSVSDPMTDDKFCDLMLEQYMKDKLKHDFSNCNGSVSCCSYLNRLKDNLYNDTDSDVLADYLHL